MEIKLKELKPIMQFCVGFDDSPNVKLVSQNELMFTKYTKNGVVCYKIILPIAEGNGIPSGNAVFLFEDLLKAIKSGKADDVIDFNIDEKWSSYSVSAKSDKGEKSYVFRCYDTLDEWDSYLKLFDRLKPELYTFQVTLNVSDLIESIESVLGENCVYISNDKNEWGYLRLSGSKRETRLSQIKMNCLIESNSGIKGDLAVCEIAISKKILIDALDCINKMSDDVTLCFHPEMPFLINFNHGSLVIARLVGND